MSVGVSFLIKMEIDQDIVPSIFYVTVEARITGPSEDADETLLPVLFSLKSIPGPTEERNCTFPGTFDKDFHKTFYREIPSTGSGHSTIKRPESFSYYNLVGDHERPPSREDSRMVGAPGIEPRPHEPESCVLPLYYAPRTLIPPNDVF